MNKVCMGCGVLLQASDPDDYGYTKNLNNDLCERCFRIEHYGEYQRVTKDNQEFIEILKAINKTKDLVLLVVDCLAMNHDFNLIKQYLVNNPLLLVLTKSDLIPDLEDQKLITYMNHFELNPVDTIVISSYKNYHFDLLMAKIDHYQQSKQVYVVGYTNAGKSAMINKIIYNYTKSKIKITTSMLPSTTLKQIKVPVSTKLTIIDTPGLLDEGSIYDAIDDNQLKLIIPAKTIKPAIYQVRGHDIFIVDHLFRLDIDTKNVLVFFLSNSLVIDHLFKETDKLKELARHDLKVDNNNDVVITGLGFIKIRDKTKLTIYAPAGVKIFTRESLI